MITRRAFSAFLSAAAVAREAIAASKLSLHVGHTGLTWIPLGGAVNPKPPITPMEDPQYVDAAHPDEFPVPINAHDFLQERLREIKLI